MGRPHPCHPHPSPRHPTTTTTTHTHTHTHTGDTASIRKSEGGAIKDVPTSTARVADATGSVTLHLVGADECAPGVLCPGDTYALRGGLFTAERGGGNALRAGRKGQLERTGYLTSIFAESPDMSAVRFEQDAATGLNTPAVPLPGRAWAPPGGGGQ
jgi:hypothetical protein